MKSGQVTSTAKTTNRTRKLRIYNANQIVVPHGCIQSPEVLEINFKFPRKVFGVTHTILYHRSDVINTQSHADGFKIIAPLELFHTIVISILGILNNRMNSPGWKLFGLVQLGPSISTSVTNTVFMRFCINVGKSRKNTLKLLPLISCKTVLVTEKAEEFERFYGN